MPTSVLIVDDDPSFRDTAGDLLRIRGFVVAGEASNHTQALAAVRRLRPDAVLLDIHLPEVDGLDVVNELLRAGDRPRVLLTSSDAYAATEQLARASGAVGFLPKAELATGDLGALLVRRDPA